MSQSADRGDWSPDRRDLLGYLDHWTVAPGDQLAAHLSADQPRLARLTVERVICGDAARGLRTETLKLPGLPATVRLAPHAICPGSCLLVEGIASLGPVRLAFWVKPTLDVAATVVDLEGVQLRRRSGGALELVGPAGTTQAQGSALRSDSWVEIVLDLDPRSGRVGLVAPGSAAAGGWRPVGGGCVALGSGLDAEGRPFAGFDGLLEDVRLLGPKGEALADLDVPGDPASPVVEVRGAPGLRAQLVNAPMRAAPGRLWTGQALSPREDPSHYAALRFHSDDLEDAGWPETLALDLPADLPSGSYALAIEAGDEVLRLPFFVTPAPGRDCRPVVFLASTQTYHAYANLRIPLESPEYEVSELSSLPVLDQTLVELQERPELGGSHYDRHPDGHAIHVTTRRRPTVNIAPGTALWAYNADTHVTAFLEDTGTPFDVVTDDALHERGAVALRGARVVVTGTHPEYASDALLDALEGFLTGGGRLMYLGGNGFYWRVALPPDRPWLMEVRRAESGARYNQPGPGEDHFQFGGHRSGLWRRLGRPPQRLVGVGMVADGWDGGTGYRLGPDAASPRAAFAIDGIEGPVIGAPCAAHDGAAGQELDAADPALGTPPHALVLGSSGPHSRAYYLAPEEVVFLHPSTTGDVSPAVRADLVLFETPAGGAVFSTGSIAWAAAMQDGGALTDVGLMTRNVLRRFADPAPFAYPPDEG